MRAAAVTAIAALAVFGTTALLTGGIVRVAWPALRRRLARREPDRRAAALLMLRCLPIGAGLLAGAGLVLPAFVAYEPAQADERIIPIATAAALAGLALLAAMALRCVRALRETGSTIAGWSRLAAPASGPYPGISVFRLNVRLPVVALAGLRRPRLFVGAPVLDRLPAGQLKAMIEHERAHLLARDNAKRVVWSTVWDPLSWSRVGNEMLLDWELAAEESADQAAIGVRGTTPLALAGALIGVARLAPATLAPGPLLASFHQDRNLERRVGRLLRPEAPPAAAAHRKVRVRRIGLLLLAGGAILASWELRQTVHALVELAISTEAPSTSAGSR